MWTGVRGADSLFLSFVGSVNMTDSDDTPEFETALELRDRLAEEAAPVEPIDMPDNSNDGGAATGFNGP